MKVTIFGSGYVGLVTGACFAKVGHQVICVDTDQEKIKKLKQGISPIFEPGLSELLKEQLAKGNLQFTTDAHYGIHHSTFLFIAVGTPSSDNGTPDLTALNKVVRTIANHLQEKKFIINKSTVPVGSAEKIKHLINDELQKNSPSISFAIISNPEFLREGCAINDFMQPDRIIVGAENPEDIEAMQALYAPFIKKPDQFITMDNTSAELTKYAANAMLATKISFINEMANVAEKVGADIEKIRIGIGSDTRIGFHFINPGCGYGGSCFPKDIQGLIAKAKEVNYTPEILQAVATVNNQQKLKIYQKINSYFASQLQGKTIALWGLAFKPNTDDIREAPSRVLMEALWQQGAKIQAYDPAAIEAIHAYYGKRDDLQLSNDLYAVLEGADVLAIVTEWQHFKTPDFDKIKQLLKYPAIFDGRNLYEPSHIKKFNISYFAIGRGETIATHSIN